MADQIGNSEGAVIRSLPHSLEAEQSVVGSMIVDREAIDRATALISGEDFYDRQLGLLFDAIVSLDAERRPIDAVTLQERLREMNAPPQVSDITYIASLIEGAPVVANAGEYAQIISERATLRKLIRATGDISNRCYTGGNTQEILEEAEREVFGITQKKSAGEVEPIRRTISEAIDRIEAAGRVHGNITGVATHFQDLDYYTSGFQPSDLILIAARPSMGKTAFALNIAQNMLVRGSKSIAFFSLEMSRIQLVNRMLSMHSHVDSHNIRTGELTDSNWADLVESADILGRTELIIDDTPGISVNELRSRCRRYKAEKNIDAVFIDYLQLMTGSGKRSSDSRQQEISEISRSLKAIARELDVPVVALSQLSRAVEQRPDKRPMLSDLRESGAIEQDADVVMFIYREDYYKKDTERKNVADIIIAKQRNGPVGTIELVWLPQYTKFESKAR
ncbi:MAG: replicative DNA helicase [Lachnospiraceae bacterium]|nr:replicative DNA helicase [Lachnospiraceae bacterium]